jgi:hypothetical protein
MADLFDLAVLHNVFKVGTAGTPASAFNSVRMATSMLCFKPMAAPTLFAPTPAFLNNSTSAFNHHIIITMFFRFGFVTETFIASK